MSRPAAALEAATAIADGLLFPSAMATDAADLVPRGHLDELAAAGLYGLFGPEGAGGLAADPETEQAVVEALAGGCLTTTFIWIQHHAALRAVNESDNPGLRDEWMADLCRGTCRAGVAVAGIRPSVTAVSARAVAGGWRVNGAVPWVTGWGRIDVLLTAARDPDGAIVWSLIDAVESPSLVVAQQRLVAVQASGTVVVTFRDHFVPAARTTGIERYDAWLARDARGLRTNGSLALGVTARCCRLLGPGPLDDSLAAGRARLDRAARADVADLADARADAAALGVRAAAALVVTAGSRAILLDQHPQRLAREATFLLVFASRPGIRDALRRRFEGP